MCGWDAYRAHLNQFVYHSGLIMRPVFAAAKANPKRVVYCEGEEERVLRAVQTVVDESLARPIVVGRPFVVNLLVAPTLDAANVSYNLLKAAAGEGVSIGPLLLGAARPVHILTLTLTSRRIVNVSALTSVAAHEARDGGGRG